MAFISRIAVAAGRLLQVLQHLLANGVQIHLRLGFQAARDQLRKGDEHAHHEQLDQQEGNGALVNLHRRHRLHELARDAVHIGTGRRHGAQEKQSEAERRMQERSLHVHRQQHAEPHQVNAQLLGHWRQQRHDDERQLEIVQKEREEEHHHVHQNQKAHRAARQVAEQAFHPQRAVRRLEHQAEDGGANENEHGKRGQLGRGRQRLPE